MSGWGEVLALVAALGGGTAIAALVLVPWTIRKMRAETTRAEVDTALAAGGGVDAHWQAIVSAQVEVLVEPMQERIRDLEARQTELEAQLARYAARYWTAVRALRLVYRWVEVHLPGAKPPELHADLVGDVAL